MVEGNRNESKGEVRYQGSCKKETEDEEKERACKGKRVRKEGVCVCVFVKRREERNKKGAQKPQFSLYFRYLFLAHKVLLQFQNT